MNLVTGELAAMEKLRAPFPASETGQLPRGGTTLAYVGHAAITGRLLDVDPSWQWKPLATDERGLPVFDVDERGNKVGLWIELTVLDVSRLGYGSCPPGQFDAVKVLVGDALRNAAMRFGVALDLWVKGSPELPQEADEKPRVTISGLNVKAFIDACAAGGVTAMERDDIVAKASRRRTIEPTELYADEVPALREAFERFVERKEAAAKVHEENLAAVAVKPGKSVPKRPLPQTEGIENVETGTLV